MPLVVLQIGSVACFLLRSANDLRASVNHLPSSLTRTTSVARHLHSVAAQMGLVDNFFPSVALQTGSDD
jgi:hypothetical protein